MDTKKRMKKFGDKVHFHRMLTTEAVKNFTDESVDYVYIDARHDYLGVKEDIESWWPKLRAGGILAGHDFENADECPKRTGQVWSISEGGIDNGNKAVRAAVEEFSQKVNIQFAVTYKGKDPCWKTWYMRKIH